MEEPDLAYAALSEVDLSEANLEGANLEGAELARADLRRANLRGANLEMADLSGADLTEADLGGANLEGASLDEANLTDADLTNARLPVARRLRAPSGRNRISHRREAEPTPLLAQERGASPPGHQVPITRGRSVAGDHQQAKSASAGCLGGVVGLGLVALGMLSIAVWGFRLLHG